MTETNVQDFVEEMNTLLDQHDLGSVVDAVLSQSNGGAPPANNG